MRALAIFCVIVVMVLNMVPCADAHDYPAAAASFSSADDSKSHEVPVEDACTPFCHCSCCASSVVLKLAAGLTPLFSISQSSATEHFEGRSLDVSLAVWQPPKLV